MLSRSAIKCRSVSGALALAGLVWMVAAVDVPFAQAQTYTVLFSFKGGAADGMNPEGGLYMNKAGDLYGTTVQGPTCKLPCSPFFGTVFRLTPAGKQAVVHHFSGDPDGASPYGGFSAYPYGTTAGGGTSNKGVVFKLGTDNAVTVVHNFTGSPADGASPYTGLVQDPEGNLYGTTAYGGKYDNGVVFKLTAAGTETVLYSFTGGADGGIPYGNLVLNSAGTLFGTASAGGNTTGNCFPSGCGVVFSLNSAGTESVLYTFTGTSTDGANPYAGLVQDTEGNLYGTTFAGGAGSCSNGCGAVFKVDTAGAETVLYLFTGSPADGASPYAGLVRDTSGNLYGTTAYGGPSDNGVVFKVNPAGTETLLHTFTGGADGAVPRSPLIMDTAGNLYGMTYNGGIAGPKCGGGPESTCGVVFKIVP